MAQKRHTSRIVEEAARRTGKSYDEMLEIRKDLRSAGGSSTLEELINWALGRHKAETLGHTAAEHGMRVTEKRGHEKHGLLRRGHGKRESGE